MEPITRQQPRMLPQHWKILAALEKITEPHGEMCAYFKSIAVEAEIADIREIRRIVRYLARKGLAEYFRALWTEDGMPAGAGYCITVAGRSAVRARETGGRSE